MNVPSVQQLIVRMVVSQFFALTGRSIIDGSPLTRIFSSTQQFGRFNIIHAALPFQSFEENKSMH